MKRELFAVAFVAVILSGGSIQREDAWPLIAQSGPPAGPQAPKFTVDPSWPKIPDKWLFGWVASVSIDADDHVWILQRPSTLEPNEKARAAPPVLEFDAAGNFLRAWGGPSAGYEWPASEHGVYIDHKGFVWIGGNGPKDHQILKFTKDGKFVMQIGKAGSKQRQFRHAEPESARRHVRAHQNERAIRCGRLRQPPHHRLRRRHGKVQAHVGRLRKQADR